VRNYGVRYWEIGNENWHNDTGTPEAVQQACVLALAALVGQHHREPGAGLQLAAGGGVGRVGLHVNHFGSPINLMQARACTAGRTVRQPLAREPDGGAQVPAQPPP